VRGEHRSPQVERVLERLLCITLALSRLRCCLKSASLRRRATALWSECLSACCLLPPPLRQHVSLGRQLTVAGHFLFDHRNRSETIMRRLHNSQWKSG
jgi:hypothetical protein